MRQKEIIFRVEDQTDLHFSAFHVSFGLRFKPSMFPVFFPSALNGSPMRERFLSLRAYSPVLR
jgi:hypothetical protein